ncbi:hypothetical protein [Paracandidimonas soli]|uniref:hypothetical protein n=1 Tax=Paracandidimonas soli TaxID=1917182 RepID=UPI00105255D1|nr:hypothetical protein [Paracandidimonas soli]
MVVALLAQTSSAQRGHVRDMAAYITPREGFTAHLLTTEAAARMRHLIERSDHFSSPASRATPGDGDTS